MMLDLLMTHLGEIKVDADFSYWWEVSIFQKDKIESNARERGWQDRAKNVTLNLPNNRLRITWLR